MSFMSAMLVAVTFVEAMIGASAHHRKHKLSGYILFGCAIITLFAGVISLWNDTREWSLTDQQQKSLTKHACEVRSKFPFIISHPPGIPEASLPARQIQDAFAKCGWIVPTNPMDYWLPPETQHGIYVAYGAKELLNPDVQTKVRELSFILLKADVAHSRKSHTALDHMRSNDTPLQVGIVVGKKPTLMEYLFGYD